LGWKKREISEKEVEQFSRRFQEQARFLVDESLGVEASRVISDSGWDAIYVGDVGLTGRSDEDVMNYAKQEGRIILTHDQDFLDDRRFPMDQNPGVVVLPGAMGATPALEMELARVVVTIGQHGKAYVGYKIRIREDGTWAIRDRDCLGGMKEARLVKFGSDGEIWELEQSS
jgi:predicted nuclease of predicted toxin-antitoxin system